jgi:serine/threonine protein kinase
MDIKEIVAGLAKRSIILSSQVYSQPKVSVYQGKYQDLEAAVKLLRFAPEEDPKGSEDECWILEKMQHSRIVKIFDHCWLQDETFSYLVIVTEWCPKDLWRDVENRKTHNFPFEEKEIWNIAHQLVSAFAYMQSIGYAHRDIKPENIFLFLDGSVRVGDLGSAEYIPCNPQK